MTVRKHNLARALAAFVATGSLLLAGALSASAAPVEPLTTEQESRIRVGLETYGVGQDVQDSLISKITAGEMWDSLAAVEPVTTEQRLVRGEFVTLSTYADGSITASGVERATTVNPGSITPLGVRNCTSRQSGQVRIKTGCEVWADAILVKMSFTADYNQTFSASDPAYAIAGTIVGVRDKEIRTIGGTYTVRNFGRTQINATASSPAKARLTADLQAFGSYAATTVWLQLNVPMNTYTLGYSSNN